ncbi:MAG TPA: response regulator transcription factor [Terriglobia bacterium]|nr:response regulator transcription factor [Terriglobia bacterium]
MVQQLEPKGQQQADRAIRVVVADDHFAIRDGVKFLLERASACQVVGEAATGRAAVEQAAALHPDVVVLDVRMPELNGLEATRQIRQRQPKTQVLVLTALDSESLVSELLRAGALGYVLKTDAVRDIVAAVRSVAGGRPFFTLRVANAILRGYLASFEETADPLTARERETVQLLAEGRSNKEVAVALGISVKTAETHRAHVMQALRLRSVSDLVHYAVRQNIIAP